MARFRLLLRLSLSILPLAASGCGQDAPTCASICALPNAPGGCESTCEDHESACASTGHAAAFQLYLTCVENSGGYSVQQQSVDTTNPTQPSQYTTTSSTSCAAELATLTSECNL